MKQKWLTRPSTRRIRKSTTGKSRSNMTSIDGKEQQLGSRKQQNNRLHHLRPHIRIFFQ
jgi:hypothetical protein